MNKSLIAVCGLFVLAMQPLSAQAASRYKGTVFFEFRANGELAQVLCYQKNLVSFGEVLFKGPSGAKIRAIQTKDENFFGHTIEFTFLPSRIEFKSTSSTIFYEQNLPIPVIYVVNGVAIAGIGDGGAREKELNEKVHKEFAKLPMEFQQGLREFYLYCTKSVIGLVGMAVILDSIFGKQMEPYQTDKLINTNSYDIQAFEDEFKGK